MRISAGLRGLIAGTILFVPSINASPSTKQSVQERDAVQLIEVSAGTLLDLAEELFLDFTCLLEANPLKIILSPGDQVEIPLACCGTSCAGSFCSQRSECGGQSSSSAPQATSSTTAHATITNTASTDSIVVTTTTSATNTLSTSTGAVVSSSSLFTSSSASNSPSTSFSSTSSPSTSSSSTSSSSTSSSATSSSATSSSPTSSSSTSSSSTSFSSTSSSSTSSSSTSSSLTSFLSSSPPSSSANALSSSTSRSGAVLSSSSFISATVSTGLNSTTTTLSPQTAYPETVTLSSTGATTITVTTVTAPPTITLAPDVTQIPVSVPPSGPPEQQCAATLANQTYILPHTISVELLQRDGSTVTLLSNAIVYPTTTFSVPACSEATTFARRAAEPQNLLIHKRDTVSDDDQSVTVAPLPKGTLDTTNSQSGGSLVVSALKNLATTATSIIDSVGQIEQWGLWWADGDISDAEYTTNTEPLLDSAIKNLYSFNSVLELLFDDYTSSIYALSQNAKDTLWPARTGATSEYDILTNIDDLNHGLGESSSNAYKDKLKTYYIIGSSSEVALQITYIAIKKFVEFDWSDEEPQATNTLSKSLTSSSSISSSSSSGISSSSSSSSSSSTATPTPYLLIAYPDTDPDKFQTFIKTLPDQGQGTQIVFPNVPYFGYATQMSQEQAQDVATNPILKYCEEDIESNVDDGSYAAMPSKQRLKSRVNDLEPTTLIERTDSAQHLKLISATDPLPAQFVDQKDYLFDSLDGDSSTIYVIDTGVNQNHIDFRTKIGFTRRVRGYALPNRVTLSRVPEAYWGEEGIYDCDQKVGHGTRVASIAAGLYAGVASNANLVNIKFRNRAKSTVKALDDPQNTWIARGVTDSALALALNWALNDVIELRNQGNTGKSVINLSSGYDHGNKDSIMSQFVSDATALDVVFVTATGNDGTIGASLDMATPQSLGAVDNAIITVGGVDYNGFLHEMTTFDAGKGGSITLYAACEAIVAADPDSQTAFTLGRNGPGDGTSFAAPAVAGLAAYFFSLPALSNQWRAGSVAQDMKNYLTQYAKQRQENSLQRLAAFTDYRAPAADSIKVAYNRAPEGLCAAQLPTAQKAKMMAVRQDQGGDVTIVSSGTIVASTMAQSYCEATLTTSATPTPTPTDAGKLTCGARTDQGDSAHWFSLDEANQAAHDFCTGLTTSGKVFKPGTTVGEEDTEAGNIEVSLFWEGGNNSSCPTFDPSDNDNNVAYNLCMDRLGTIINDCDTKSNGFVNWKQGGGYERDCLNWLMTKEGPATTTSSSVTTPTPTPTPTPAPLSCGSTSPSPGVGPYANDGQTVNVCLAYDMAQHFCGFNANAGRNVPADLLGSTLVANYTYDSQPPNAGLYGMYISWLQADDCTAASPANDVIVDDIDTTCRDALMSIINNCDTDTQTEKRGGTFIDTKNCYEWAIFPVNSQKLDVSDWDTSDPKIFTGFYDYCQTHPTQQGTS